MAYQYTVATIVNIINETDATKRFFIKFPDDYRFNFKAGQFVMIDLPIDHKYTNRAYSIASAPSDDNTFELCIVLNPDGKGTPYMWENYEIGDEVMVSKALGKFGLPNEIDRDICFICTGTGIAPLRSMLVDILKQNRDHKNIYMIFGTRFEKDILYRKEMKVLMEEHPTFKFIPVLSREDSWSGEKGYVHSVYEYLFSDVRPAYFYICGWKNMLNETRQRLESMGYDKKYIKFESYD